MHVILYYLFIFLASTSNGAGFTWSRKRLAVLQKAGNTKKPEKGVIKR
jgi:hypothetical protein